MRINKSNVQQKCKLITKSYRWKGWVRRFLDVKARNPQGGSASLEVAPAAKRDLVHLLSPLFTAGNTELNECFKLLSSASSSFFWKWLHWTFASTENHDCRQMSSQSSDPTACFLSLIAPLSPKILLNGLLGKGMNIEKRRFLKNINKSVFTFKNIKS